MEEENFKVFTIFCSLIGLYCGSALVVVCFVGANDRDPLSDFQFLMFLGASLFCVLYGVWGTWRFLGWFQNKQNTIKVLISVCVVTFIFFALKIKVSGPIEFKKSYLYQKMH